MTPNVEEQETGIISNDEFSYVHSKVRTPPPPGFAVNDGTTTSYKYDRTGAGSAPPRSLISDGISLDEICSSRIHEDDADDISGYHDHLRMMQRRAAGDYQIKIKNANERSSSFVNLAAALGEGLAESIGDSIAENKHVSDLSR